MANKMENASKVPKLNIRFPSPPSENESEDGEHPMTVLIDSGYSIKGKIGAGAFSSVLKAFSKTHNQIVAVKVISKLRASQQVLTKFLPREIELVKVLKHPNLIRYYECIETTMRYYIIMQYAENGSLLSLLQHEKYLRELVAKQFFHQLIDAVEYIHSMGVVHRDIKCENIVFDEHRRLKLIDFGFARGNMQPIEVGSKIRPVMSNTFCGSHAYASPEILKCQMYQPQLSDIWATGVVLYRMVYGHLPFTNVHNVNFLLKQIAAGPIFPRNRKISADCKDVIKRIMRPVATRITIKELRKHPWMEQDYTDCEEEEETPKPNTIEPPGESISMADSTTDDNGNPKPATSTTGVSKNSICSLSRTLKRKRT